MSTRQATSASPSTARLLRAPGMRSAKRDDWAQLLRFCVVGTSGYVINLAVFATLIHAAGTHYQLAAVGSFAVAWTSNFMLNKHWTFRRHGLSALQQGARNLLVSLVALGLNLLALWAFVSAGAPELPAQAAAILLVTPVNFILNRRWSFR